MAPVVSFGRAAVRRAVAREVRAARIASKLTQRQLAARMRRTPSYVAEIERGERPVEVEELVRLAKALGISPIELLTKIAG